MSLTVRQLYGVTSFVVTSIAIGVGCYLSPPREWKMFQKKTIPKAAQNQPGPFVGDGYAEVSEWLRQNLDDPDFEKVRWWPVRSLAEDQKKIDDFLESRREREAKQLEQAESDLTEAKKALEVDRFDVVAAAKHAAATEAIELLNRGRIEVVARLPDFACRLKFRSKNKFGANELHDRMFTVDRGRVKPISAERAEKWKLLFPE